MIVSVPSYVLTYKDAVESAIIKQHWLLQFKSVRLVIPRFQQLVSCAWTESEKLSPRYGVHRGHKSENARTDEPTSLLPAHCSCFRVSRAVLWFVRAGLEESDAQAPLRKVQSEFERRGAGLKPPTLEREMRGSLYFSPHVAPKTNSSSDGMECCKGQSGTFNQTSAVMALCFISYPFI